VLCRLFAIISDRPGRSIWYWRRNIKKRRRLLIAFNMGSN
jgi:hypothetical protein